MNEPLSYTEFIQAFPEFANLAEPTVKFRLDFSNAWLSPGVWGKLWNHACGLVTAHYLFLRYNVTEGLAESGVMSPTSAIGVATNISANTSGLSQGMTVSGLVSSDNPVDADFARTEYGLEFLNLLYTMVPAGSVVYSPDTSAALAGER